MKTEALSHMMENSLPYPPRSERLSSKVCNYRVFCLSYLLDENHKYS